MVHFVQHPKYGQTIDYDFLRASMKEVYDSLYPEFNMIASMQVGTRLFGDEPSYMIAAGASMLAWMMLLAAEEYELAEQHKDSIFTLGWTEEHCGTDLLSVRTQATPMSDDPNEKMYYIKGQKWLINNSANADYHMVVAKIDPTQDGPRSLSIFLVPNSSTHSWERLETHVLRNMVLTKFQIDGPGRLVGKRGHGLSIIQRMAMPSKYQCSYVGNQMLLEALPATIAHLSSKRIFSDNPINFSNVYRQLYNLTLQGALLHYIYQRACALSDTSFLQFYGTMLKSWMLLQANEVLSKNWLVAGSKGFLRESVIGRDAIDSFVLPVFDGHYTLNTLMTAKHADRYLEATRKESALERIELIRNNIYEEIKGNQIDAKPGDIRKPDFFDYADYIEQLAVPLDLNPRGLIASARQLIADYEAMGVGSEADTKYKIGSLLHWLESLLAACELWKITGEEPEYLNLIIQQYNNMTKAFNDMVSESNLPTHFLMPLRQRPITVPEDPTNHLLSLLNIQPKIKLVTEKA